MNQAIKLEVNLIQKSKFPKPLPLEVILGDSFQYGAIENNHFVVRHIHEEGFLCFHPSHIGRGIRVYWNEEEKENIGLVLLLPSTQEEIYDFIELIVRITKEWTCSITLNSNPVTSQELVDMEEELEGMNSKILQDLVNNLMENENQYIELSCAMHKLALSKKEVLSWKNVSNTNLFRDWLHAKQKEMVYIVESEFLDREEGTIGLFTLPIDVPIILLKNPSNSTNKNVEKWIVQFFDADNNAILGYISYEDFMKELDDIQYEDYDALHWLIKPFGREMVQYYLASVHHG